MSFASNTAVEIEPGSPTARAHIDPGWDIGGNTNGGYMLAIVGRALTAMCDRPDPVSVTAHYLTPGRHGPASIDTEVVKVGKRFATASALLRTDRPVMAVLGTFGDLDPAAGAGSDAHLVDATAPDLPPVEDCVSMAAGESAPPFMQRVDLRLHPDDATFAGGDPSGTPRVRGWFRLSDGEPMDTVALLLAVDAFPPTVFNARLPIGWTPTVELTAHVRARPAPGWLRCAFSTRFVTGGFLEEDGEIWDAEGRLVAQSRQLALVARPG